MTSNADPKRRLRDGPEDRNKSSFVGQLTKESTIYQRHLRRRARTSKNMNDPRSAVIRVLANLPGFAGLVGQYETDDLNVTGPTLEEAHNTFLGEIPSPLSRDALYQGAIFDPNPNGLPLVRKQPRWYETSRASYANKAFLVGCGISTIALWASRSVVFQFNDAMLLTGNITGPSRAIRYSASNVCRSSCQHIKP